MHKRMEKTTFFAHMVFIHHKPAQHIQQPRLGLPQGLTLKQTVLLDHSIQFKFVPVAGANCPGLLASA